MGRNAICALFDETLSYAMLAQESVQPPRR